jgi:hypothetical protein
MQTIVKWTTLGLLGVGLLGLEAAGVRRVALSASEWLVGDEAQALARGSRIAATDAMHAVAREARETALAAAVGTLERVGAIYAVTQGPERVMVRKRVRVIQAPCDESAADHPVSDERS